MIHAGEYSARTLLSRMRREGTVSLTIGEKAYELADKMIYGEERTENE